ncbi:hypothetical protein OSTOST_11440, partial [Ostertagia ostertagi]
IACQNDGQFSWQHGVISFNLFLPALDTRLDWVTCGDFRQWPTRMEEIYKTAFLIPYVICSVLVGLPCLYLELFIGQFTQSGPSRAFWYFMPTLQGNQAWERF